VAKLNPKEIILSLIAEEKDNFNKYSQLCSIYQVPTDPLVVARSQGRLEILQLLLKDKILMKI